MSNQVLTEEHPLLAVKEGSTAKDFLRFNISNSTLPEWMSAKDIKVGDYLSIPKIEYEESNTCVQFAKYGDEIREAKVYSSARGRVGLPQNFYINEDLAWFLGLYSGDGCVVSNKSIRIDLGKNEGYIVERMTRLFNSLGIGMTVKEEDTVIHVNIYSKVFVSFVKDVCPGNVYSKLVSKFVQTMSHQNRLAFVTGFIEADGNVGEGRKVTAATVSSSLAHGVANLFNSLGFLAKVKEENHTTNFGKSKVFKIAFPNVFKQLGVEKLKNVDMPTRVGHFNYLENDSFFFVKVRKVAKQAHTGPVYNCEVEDNHSYIANQVASHNCYSPLELAVINITNHLNVENYNANFFTHGYAARGILHLKGTVTQGQLTAFRRQFYNTISGVQNAWRTPIIAGLDEVQWTSLSGSAKEMEYLNYNNHLMRTVCTMFQIDPVELGLDYLISGGSRQGGGQQQANNEYKVNFSRERGLIPVLMMFEDLINCSILPAIDIELAKKYEFKFTGIDEDSPQTHVAQLQAEMTVHSTMNDLLRANGKETMKHEIADLPMNQTFWMLVEKNMTKAEIRSTFFGDKEAMGKRELAYFPADSMFMGWQQLLLTIDRSKAQDKLQHDQMKAQQEQAEEQSKQAAAQQQLEQGKHDREQEAHDMTMDQVKARQAHAAVAHETLKDSAKQFGAGAKAIESPGGAPLANPINSPTADES
jgi:hypothetical protein